MRASDGKRWERVPDQTCPDIAKTGPKRGPKGMGLRTDYGSISHLPKHDSRSRQTICHGGNGSRVRAKKTGKSYRKVTGEVEAQLCVIACSDPPEGYSRWTMQRIADERMRLEVVDYITDSTVCEAMKKMNLSRGRWKNGAFQQPVQSL